MVLDFVGSEKELEREANSKVARDEELQQGPGGEGHLWGRTFVRLRKSSHCD